MTTRTIKTMELAVDAHELSLHVEQIPGAQLRKAAEHGEIFICRDEKCQLRDAMDACGRGVASFGIVSW